MATFTRHARYFPDFEWHRNLLSFNLFRLFEQIFGRRYGIRAEAMMCDGVYTALSFEAKIVHTEVLLREGILKLWNSKPRLVWVPIYQPSLAYVGAFIKQKQGYRLAVAFDNSDSSRPTSSLAYTCTGSNRYLAPCPLVQPHTASVSTMTYNSVGLSQIVALINDGASDENIYFFGLANPASGSNTLAATYSGSTVSVFQTLSYSGVNQSTTPDNSGTAQTTGSTATITITVNTANSWLIGGARTNVSFTSAGSGTTSRTTLPNNYPVFDSNGALATGSHSLNLNLSSAAYGMVGLSLAPPTVAANSNFLAFM